MLLVLSYVKEVRAAIEQGMIRGEKGEDGYTPQAGHDYLSLPAAQAQIDAVLSEAVAKIQSDAKNALSQVRNGRDGKDAVITDEHLQKAANIASTLIQLPDFNTLITQEPEAIRNALELLSGDERLEMSAVKGLVEVIEELKKRPTGPSGVGGIRFLSQLVDVYAPSPSNGHVLKWNSTNLRWEAGAVAGTGDMEAATYDPQAIAGDAFDTDNHTSGTTNKVYTAVEQTKLAGIEALADVTDATNVDAAGAVMNSDTSTAAMQFVIDEDAMTSNSATKVPTQQSVKAYVDAEISGVGGGVSEALVIAYSVAL